MSSPILNYQDECLLKDSLNVFFSLYGNTFHRLDKNKVDFHATEYWKSLNISGKAFLVISMDKASKKDMSKLYMCWMSGGNIVSLYKQLCLTI